MKAQGGKLAVNSLVNWFEYGVLLWENPAWSGLFALLGYILLAQARGPVLVASQFPYYNYLADAFLHGQLSLRLIPPQVHDLVHYGSRYYLYWPPFPAILLMPFVALFGVQFSDISFTLILGALDVGLVALLLRQASEKKVISLSPTQRALLVLFFAFGTVHFTLASFGRVWFTGELVGFSCVVFAYLAAISLSGWKAFLLSGLAIAGAAATRNHLVFAGIWPAYYLLQKHGRQGWRCLLTGAIAGAVPLILAVALLALYNWLRFGSPTNVGLDYHLMARNFVGDYQRYGAFSLHYLPTNLYYQYLFYPFPLRNESMMGGSLFLLSPVFFAAFWGIAWGRPRLSALALFASILLVSIPILLLMGTGWVQFGPRYTLDFTIPLLLLSALGIKRWPVQILGLLVLLSIAQYLSGALFLLGAM